MISRRALLFAAAAPVRWRMPEEAAPHKRTWMTFGAHQNIWGARLTGGVQRNLATIAEAIARFEPVTVLVEPSLRLEARQALPAGLEQVPAGLDDLWARDTGPTFVLGAGRNKAAVDWNFNGWGEKQAHDRDAEVAALIARRAGAARLQAEITLEAGAIATDGQGTALVAESAVLNDNRNPGVSKAEVEFALRSLLGLEKIIWLPGARGGDFTDGHTHFFARFAAPGVVVYHAHAGSAASREHLRILKGASDAAGRALELAPLKPPGKPRDRSLAGTLAATYLGYYVCNGAVIAQEFGDAKTDAAARAMLQKLYPSRQVIQLPCDALAAGGGTIHRVTLQEPA